MKDTFGAFTAIFLAVIILFSLLVRWRVFRLARKMTHQIVWVRDTIDKATQRRKNEQLNLEFRPTNHELNELIINFNRNAKTVYIAMQATNEGESNTALLNYHEALDCFKFFGNEKEQGICQNNIGFVLLEQGKVDQALRYFYQAMQTQERFIGLNPQEEFNINDVILCVRQLQYAMGIHLLICDFERKQLILKGKGITHFHPVKGPVKKILSAAVSIAKEDNPALSQLISGAKSQILLRKETRHMTRTESLRNNLNPFRRGTTKSLYKPEVQSSEHEQSLLFNRNLDQIVELFEVREAKINDAKLREQINEG